MEASVAMPHKATIALCVAAGFSLPAVAWATTPASSTTVKTGCHPSYSPCLPVGADLDCDDVTGPIAITGDDPYRLDGDDQDGIGCEITAVTDKPGTTSAPAAAPTIRARAVPARPRYTG